MATSQPPAHRPPQQLHQPEPVRAHLDNQRHHPLRQRPPRAVGTTSDSDRPAPWAPPPTTTRGLGVGPPQTTADPAGYSQPADMAPASQRAITPRLRHPAKSSMARRPSRDPFTRLDGSDSPAADHRPSTAPAHPRTHAPTHPRTHAPTHPRQRRHPATRDVRQQRQRSGSREPGAGSVKPRGAVPTTRPTSGRTRGPQHRQRDEAGAWENEGGQGRGRTGDLPLFRRTLVPTELPGPAVWPGAGIAGCGPYAAIGRFPGPLATPTGLEPATSAVTGRRANQLRHGAIHRKMCDRAYPQRDSNPRYRLERAAS